MRHFVVATVLVLLTALRSYAGEVISPYLVGVWATDASVVKGPFLFEGKQYIWAKTALEP